MQKFGETLKHKLEHLDSEIVKLKGGFINVVDYDEVYVKMFEYTQESDLAGFVKIV